MGSVSNQDRSSQSPYTILLGKLQQRPEAHIGGHIEQLEQYGVPSRHDGFDLFDRRPAGSQLHPALLRVRASDGHRHHIVVIKVVDNGVRIGPQPRAHDGQLELLAEFRVIEHHLRVQVESVHERARGDWGVGLAQQQATQDATFSVAGHDHVRLEGLSADDQDGSLGRAMLDVLHEAAEADGGASFDGCLVEHLDELAPVDLQVRRAELVLRVGREPVPVEDGAVTIGPKAYFLRHGSKGLYGIENAPVAEDLCGVGGHLNASADLDMTTASILELNVVAKTWMDVVKAHRNQTLGGLDDSNSMARATEANGGAQAGDASSYNQYFHGQENAMDDRGRTDLERLGNSIIQFCEEK